MRTPAGADKLRDLCYCYCEGLQWVLSYYFAGVPSWKWFYAYHYPPWAQDLALCDLPEFTANC